LPSRHRPRPRRNGHPPPHVSTTIPRDTSFVPPADQTRSGAHRTPPDTDCLLPSRPSPLLGLRPHATTQQPAAGRARVGEWWARTTLLLPARGADRRRRTHARHKGRTQPTKQNAAAAAASGPAAAAPPREDGLGGHVEHGAVVALPRGLLRAVP
jgi:hypothetical protein